MRIIIQDLKGDEYQVFTEGWMVPKLHMVARNDRMFRHNLEEEIELIESLLIPTGVVWKEKRS